NDKGDTFVAVRDNSSAIWVNVYDGRAGQWDGWALAGGAMKGTPAVAAIFNTMYIAARDQFNAYWTNSFTRGSGFTGWTNRGGAFSTDPAMGFETWFYLVGKDNFNAIWTAFWAGWPDPAGAF